MSQQISLNMNPLEWQNNPNTVLYLGYLQTTGYSFGASIQLTGNNGFSQSFSLSQEIRPFAYGNIGYVTVPFDAFPVTLQATIDCSTDFDVVTSPQQALGLKMEGSNIIPVCYQSTVFCNDSGSDNDYNDFVLISQLFNSSTD